MMKQWEITYRAKLKATLHEGPYYFNIGYDGLTLNASRDAVIELYVALRKELMMPSQELTITELPNGLSYRTLSRTRIRELIKDKVTNLSDCKFCEITSRVPAQVLRQFGT